MPDQITEQNNRVTIVTGANSGIGFDTARMLAKSGATVVLACRDCAKAEQAKNQIAHSADADALHVMELDLSRLQSVRDFSKSYRERFNRLDLLINNAGLMMPPYTVTEDGFECQIGVNYLAHFALTAYLLPLLEQTPASRIVTLSSVGHKRGKIHFEDLHFKNHYNKGAAYCQSKLACLMFSFELQMRLQANNYQTISVGAHPGVSDTNLGRYFPRLFAWVFKSLSQSSEQGALPTLYAALGNDIVGGDYCGPDGFLDWRGSPAKSGYKPHASDPEACKKLWELSEQLTGVQMFGHTT